MEPEVILKRLVAVKKITVWYTANGATHRIMSLPKPLLVFLLLLLTGFASFPQKIRIIETTGDLHVKLTGKKETIVSSKKNKGIGLIEIHPQEQYQTIIGFGGTYSEATAYNLKKLSLQMRKELLEAFLSEKNGAGWNIIRTTINSCDASSEYYSYDETPGDTLLKDFSIRKDIENYMIPGLQQAQQIANGQLKIFASPWTPPVWMKDSTVFYTGSLRREYYAAWANYFSKYITAYKNNGVDIWAITPQNEPEAYRQAWDACGWKPEQMNDFIKLYLGPKLQKIHPQVKILAWDHNKNHLLQWCNVLFNDTVTKKYLSGIVHHWYDEGEAKQFDVLQKAKQLYPSIPLIAGEQGVFGLYLMQPAPAFLYARDIIGNMNNYSNAWVVWGMAFDHRGGPNHAKNFNHSPVMIDVEKEKLYYNPSYYFIAHFSKYVKRGAKRIGFTNNTDKILVTAFENPGKQLVVVLLNEETVPQSIQLKYNNRYFDIDIKPQSINTILITK